MNFFKFLVDSVPARRFHSASGLFKSAYVETTATKYPHVKRGSYAVLNDGDVQFFKQILGTHHVLTDPDDVAPYNVDWMRSVRGFLDSTVIAHFCIVIMLSLIFLQEPVSWFYAPRALIKSAKY